MNVPLHRILRAGLAAALLGVPVVAARADAITDWNLRTGAILVDAKLGTPPAIRTMAIVQTAAYGAVNAITGRHPPVVWQPAAAPGASVDAAVAAAHRTTLARLVPSQRPAIEAAYQSALAAIPDGSAKAAGVAAGERAAATVLAHRSDDGATAAESYRPHAAPGTYVPTALPAVPQWPQRKPWLMSSAAQFRPGPPPALTSDAWARDFDEVKSLGARTSTRRSAEQTEIARFWDFSLPPIYHGGVRSVAAMPGRDVTRNARMFAAVAQAMDDGMIAVFDAKYHYNFWRPATAIRNADLDGHDATQRDASWMPLIDAPLHPEYPSAHAILAAAVATVLEADLGSMPVPVLETSSPTARGVTRRWSRIDDFVREVADARVYEGIHYRTSTDVGIAMGRRVGQLAVAQFVAATH